MTRTPGRVPLGRFLRQQARDSLFNLPGSGSRIGQ